MKVIGIGRYCSLVPHDWKHNFMWILQSKNTCTSIRYPVGVYILPAEEEDIPFEIFFQLLENYDVMSSAIKFFL